MADEASEQHSISALALGAPTWVDSEGTPDSHVGFAALGDLVTFGLGDPVDTGCRGWARLPAATIGQDHEVSFCNTARPRATVADVRFEQLVAATNYCPHLASIVISLNDTMRSMWEPEALRVDLLRCAATLAEHSASC